MMDLLYIALGAVGFSLSWGFAHLCDVLARNDKGQSS